MISGPSVILGDEPLLHSSLASLRAPLHIPVACSLLCHKHRGGVSRLDDVVSETVGVSVVGDRKGLKET